MTEKSNRTDRGVLTFPAVHPCEGISTETLLSSLINLSQNICRYRSEFFATQRRNARQVMRKIGILLMFFEEIRDRELMLPDSIVLSFSELHVAFQKVLFLLEDCTREGSRIWMLMKSGFVVSQFRFFVRAIATALDVLPLRSVGVCGEVKELVELVAKQARKAKLEVDPGKEWAGRQVALMLDGLEKGIEPDLGLVKLVLDFVEIKTWSDCNKEVKFLDDEIRFHCSGYDENDAPLLSSLLGLMCYCRGVIFETMEHQKNEQADVRRNMETVSCLNPEEFRCPISLELMTDPVTVSTGHTYDRSSIEKWLEAGHETCPKTGKKLTNTNLVPNMALMKLIHQFCSDNGISLSKSKSGAGDITSTILPATPAAANAVRFLSRFLARRLVFGSREQTNMAAYEIRLVAKSNIFNRSCLIEAGTILPLLNLLSSPDQSMQENVIAALLKLSKHTSGKRVIIENDGIRPILEVLKSGLNLEAKQIAAATVFYLASVKGCRKLIGETPGAIQALVELIRNGTACGRMNAIVAVFTLLHHPRNHEKVVASGTVPLLLDILSSSCKDEVKVDSLAVLSALSETVDGTFAIMKTPALRVILRTLPSLQSQVAKEYCVSILSCMCKNGGDQVIEVLAQDPSLMGSLYSLVTHGTKRCIRKACALLQILHEFAETSSSGLFILSIEHARRPCC